MLKNTTLFFSLLLVLAIGCRKETDTVVMVEDPHVPVILEDYDPIIEMVTSSVFGAVIDENGEPIQGASVKLGTHLASTNDFGVFKFDDIAMNRLGTFVEVEKDAYFKTGRRFYPESGTQSSIKIELLPIHFNESFESSAGGTINVADNGGSIVFASNSIVTQDGTPYNGTVDVAAVWLSPTATNTLDQMPGALQGVNLLNEETGLLSYGMFGVELQGSNGEQLNLEEGSTAEIRMNVPAIMQAAAPTEIPLWSFNYTYGIWVEESSATLQNGQYIGEVSHFSFWNCDIPADLIHFDMTVSNSFNGEPVQGVKVSISTANGVPSSGTGYSNVDGIVSGFIPEDVDLILEILSPCGEALHTETISASSDDITLGDYQLDNFSIIEGLVMNCETTIVEDAVLIVNVDGYTSMFSVAENPFSIYVPICLTTTEVQVAGGDLATVQQGNFVTAPVAATINIGQVLACGEDLLNIFKMTVDGVTTRYYIIAGITGGPDPNQPHVTQIFISHALNEAPGVTLNVGFGYSSAPAGEYTNVPGDWSAQNFVDQIVDLEYGWTMFDDWEVLVIEEYGPSIGTEISGYVSGYQTNTLDGVNTVHFVEGTFRGLQTE